MTTKIETTRHSLAHIMAEVVQEIYPTAKFGIGPTIENGFYYDFDLPKSLTPNDLPKIEKRMKKLIKQDIKFKKKIISKTEAKKLFKNQPYKLELIKDLPGKTVSIYENGKFTPTTNALVWGFTDLCKGPHIKSGKEINTDAFKLTKIAGAYWRGDEKNPMLQRIYGIAFETKKELDDYILQQKEAEKRDHRKLGKELDLFVFSDLVGPGLPLFTPKGVVIIDELKKHIEQICAKYGFKKVLTPHLAKIELYELSGHAKKFGKELFRVTSEQGHKFAIRPVLCPHQTQIYASKTRSYRDLPIRYMETEKMYRAEKTGEVGGLNRVYSITVEDGHSFCRVDQIKQEIKNLVKIIRDFYKPLGMWDKHWVSLSVRDYKHPEKYIGDKKDWDICEKILKKISDETGLKAKRCEGEAALYGPKLDFMFKDSLGKEFAIPTIQLDFATPKRFNLTYINEKGKEVNPVMIHRAILGSYERFLALLIEHYAGAFPLWLSPVQIWIIPIGIKHKKYAEQIKKELNSFRIEVKDENQTIGKKIREGEMQKIPYLLIIGDKEVKNKTISVRKRGKGDIGEMKLAKFIEKIQKEIAQKK